MTALVYVGGVENSSTAKGHMKPFGIQTKRLIYQTVYLYLNLSFLRIIVEKNKKYHKVD